MRFAVTSLLVLAALPSVASAELITSTGPNPDFDVVASCTNTTGCNGGTPSSTVSAEADFSDFVWSANNTILTFTLTLTNTTPQGSFSLTDWQGIDLTAFGFNTAPDAATVNGNSTVFHTVVDTNFPGFNSVDICNSSANNPSNCAGGSNNGLFPNQSNTFQLTLSGLTGGQIDLGTDTVGQPERFDFKIAGIPGSAGSVEFQNTDAGITLLNSSVPEPASLAVLGSGLIGLGWFGRRRRV